MYSEKDSAREYPEPDDPNENYRSPFRKDYGRLIHSPAFRRLQGKTQLYPGLESDFFRNRLTHSLEVAQIAKSIAIRINSVYKLKVADQINPDICEFAGLAHDLGHPPFGHQGEEALDECLRDFGGFEGNAQTLRILSRIEKRAKGQLETKDNEYRFGLNVCYRSLASILKYDNVIPQVSEDRIESQKNHAIKGFYYSELPLVKTIKTNVAGPDFEGKFKTIECRIMDIADDIAYSTYDLEDGFKAGFYHPVMFFCYPGEVFENVARKVAKAIDGPFSAADVREELLRIFGSIYEFPESSFVKAEGDDKTYFAIEESKAKATFANLTNIAFTASKNLADNGYIRTEFTSGLVGEAVNGVEYFPDPQHPALSKVQLRRDLLIRVEVLKNFTFESQILSPRLKVSEFRGKEIVKEIFKALIDDEGWRLMPADYQRNFHHFLDLPNKYRCIGDFIAGMTDRYAIEFYGRLKSENPETIFKPF
ncbi:deoxyguanosinetriphosphate triphosphohydrolase family protein [Puia dinghuensis]|uniref:Deoxyguanosinetriphosphate triphosphohydrolase-like protein n=1 Tax=Puia dinghuensis TaxID=1792502 RepID=A0A8J2UAL8_9BACT|nr:dNTP triphosphohydrolase [Puia dinghuensis]GGA90201.1 deoxyguanosinetriphosphate triphosphohydrolase [Puia dinghuensis]